MSERRLVDTNLIVRHLTQDQPAMAAVASRLFDASDRGQLTLVLLPAVLAECIFVLESFYKHPRTKIASALSTLISSSGIEIDQLAIHRDALERYAKSKLHFVDCTIAAAAAAENISVASFDTGLKKMHGVRISLE
jgi:predicted nucleic-acid-binding protein